MKNCPFCTPENFASRMIKEFDRAYWILAENQFYEGYSILISKQHFREWHEVPEEIVAELNQNLRSIAATIQAKFQPHKLNLASLGNVVEHLHWHIIPRYLSDPNSGGPPNFSMPATLTPELFDKLKEKLNA
ncbi:MAG: histidine triad protein [Gammaproteobacteria bacterium]|jgi:diadenosine tetraphosphate (Ap4A) HIT family hydrolase|nr:histidine triad protein [Gammaproteobacteria bacterium]